MKNQFLCLASDSNYETIEEFQLPIPHAQDLAKVATFHMLRRRKCIVIGCGRSGTTFMSELFKQYGLDIPHEKTGNDGSVNWFRTANPKIYLKLRYGKILHQTREPLQCMSSIQTISENSWKKIKRYVPINDSDSLITKCAKYWYYWNRLAEKKSDYRYKIEDVYEILPEIFNCIGVPFNGSLQSSPIDISTNSRSEQYQPFSWEGIIESDLEMYQKCYELRSRYGYE